MNYDLYDFVIGYDFPPFHHYFPNHSPHRHHQNHSSRQMTTDTTEKRGSTSETEIDRLSNILQTFSWDLDCLESVVSDLTNTPVAERLYEKIKNGMDLIDNHRNKK